MNAPQWYIYLHIACFVITSYFLQINVLCPNSIRCCIPNATEILLLVKFLQIIFWFHRLTGKKVFSCLKVLSQSSRVVGTKLDSDYAQANTENYSPFLSVWDVYNSGHASPPPLSRLKVGRHNVQALIYVNFIIFLVSGRFITSGH
jgi:hypothetical protein